MATYGNPVHRDDLSSAMTRSQNFQFNFNINDYLLGRKPEYFVYLYNVSEERYEVSRPPIAKKITIPGRKVGEEYALVGQIPQPLLTPEGSVDSSDMRVAAQDARRFAMDIVNSENLTLDQDAVLDPKQTLSVNSDLGKRGVFWSLSNPPKPEEVLAAKRRMEKFYTFLLEQAHAVSVSNPQFLREMLTPEHHRAADYYGQEHTWHSKLSRPMDCPNCGTRVKEGIAYHIVDGDLCVIDWARTVKAGKVSRSHAYEATGDEQFAPKVPQNSGNAQGPAKVAKTDIPTEK